MPFDLEGYKEYTDEKRRQVEEANQPAPPEPSTWDKVKETAEWAGNGIASAAEEAATDIADTAGIAVDVIRNAGEKYHDILNMGTDIQKAFSNENIQRINETGDTSEQDAAISNAQETARTANRDILNAPIDFAMSPVYAVAKHNYSVDDADNPDSFSASMEKNDFWRDHVMNQEDKIARASKISETLGIDSDILLNDSEAYKGALSVYDTYQEQKRLVPEGSFDMDKVWEEFPELQNISFTDKDAVRLALKDIENTRETHNVIDTLIKSYQFGDVRMEYNNLWYKVMDGTASEDDMSRIRELKGEIEKHRNIGFLENPILFAVGGLGENLPNMVDGIVSRETMEDVAVGAAVGSVLPGLGTGAGAVSNGIRGAVMRYLAKQGVKQMAGKGMAVGMFESMFKPMAGENYEEYTGMKDKDGNLILDKDAAKTYAKTEAAIESVIEMAQLGFLTKTVKNSFVKKSVQDVVEGVLARETAGNTAKEAMLDMLKVGASESVEEALQSVTSDVVHNDIERATGDTNNKIYGATDILNRALMSAAQAFPVGMAFGLAPAGGRVISGSRRMMIEDRIAQDKYEEQNYNTLRGTIALSRLQDIVGNSSLKKMAPEKQQKVLREQLKDSPIATAYVDVEMALEKENGREDIEKVGKAAGLTQEEIDTAIEEKGHIAVSSECYAQSEASPELLESVSFAPEADSMARMKKVAADIKAIQDKNFKKQVDDTLNQINTIIDEVLPNIEDSKQREAERDLAMSVMLTNPENPKAGFKQLKAQLNADLDTYIGGALRALQGGMKQGVNIVYSDEDSTRGVRTSNNDQWYRDFYKEHGRAPYKSELEEMAVDMVTGAPNAPKVPGFVVSDAETAEKMQSYRSHIENLRKDLTTLDRIYGKIADLNTTEIETTKGLSKEAYHVYRYVANKLSSKDAPPAARRAAKVDAVIWARHADIVADIISRKTGEKYTAMDYIKQVEIDLSGKYGDGLNQNEAITGRNKLINDIANWKDNLAKIPKIKIHEKSKKYNKLIYVMDTPLVMTMVNMPHLPMYIKQGKINTIRLSDHLPMTDYVLGQIPGALTDPIAIVKSATRKDSIVAMLSLRDKNGVNVVTSIAFEKNRNGIDLNLITSSYGKGDRKINTNWYNRQFEKNSNVLYINRKKAQSLLSLGVQFPLSNNNKDISLFVDKSIKHEEDLVNAKRQNPSMYQLAGIHSLTANQEALNEAKALAEKNKSAEEIYKATGWFKGKDGKWRYEIPDNLDAIDFSALKDDGTTLQDIYDNPALYEAYTYLPYVNIYKDDIEGLGQTSRLDIILNAKALETHPDEAKKTLLHEIQHIIQDEEGFARGGNPSYVIEQLKDSIWLIKNELRKNKDFQNLYELGDRASDTYVNDLRRKYGNKRIDGVIAEIERLRQLNNAIENESNNVRLYNNLAGEQEARHVEQRALTNRANDQRIINAKNVMDEAEENIISAEGKSLLKKLSSENLEIRRQRESNSAHINIIQKTINTSKEVLDRLAKQNNPAMLKVLSAKLEESQQKLQTALKKADELQQPPELITAKNNLADLNDKEKQAVEKYLQAELEAYSAEKFSNSNTMPSPHDENALVVFQGKEVPLSYNQNNSGIKGSFTPALSGTGGVIKLFESADESTFLHETGHLFLTDLEMLAQIDERYAEDLATVNEWAEWKKGDYKLYKDTAWAKEFADREQRIIDAEAAGDLDEAEKQKAQWRQERFARGFELYLKEGSAPSAALKRVFQKFKKFLRQIYSAFTSDGAKASPKVQAVMARMIATDEEIEAMELDDRYKDIAKAGGEKLFTETDEETYERWQEQAMAEAQDKLRKIVMKDLEDAKREDFEKQIKAEEERKRKEYQSQPIYMAERAIEASGDKSAAEIWFTSYEDYKEQRALVGSLEEALKAYMDDYRQRLDEQLINSHLSEEAIHEAMESVAYRKKLRDLEAQAFAAKEALINRIPDKARNLADGLADMVNELPEDFDLKVDKRDSRVKAIMKKINQLRFSSKWSPNDLANIEAMIKANTKEELADRLAEFNEEAKRQQANMDAVMKANEGRLRMYAEQAKESVQSKPLSDAMNYQGHIRNEKLFANRRDKMIKAKNWQMALNCQQQMAMSAAMALESKKMQEKVNKILADIKAKVNRRSVKLPPQESYWLKHLAYLMHMVPTDAVEPIEGAQPIQNIFRSMIDDLDVSESAIGLFEKISDKDFKDYRQLTFSEFKEATDILKVLYNVGKDKNNLKTVGGKKISDIVEDIRNEYSIADNIERKTYRIANDKGGLGYNDLLGNMGEAGQKLAELSQKYLGNMIKPELLLRTLGKTAHKYIFGIYEKAAEAEGAMQAKEIATMRKILSRYSHKEKMAWTKKDIIFVTDRGQEKISKENVICIALNMGNKDNISRICIGFGVDESYVRKFLSENMTAKDWDFVQDIWNHLNEYWPATAKVEEELNGVHLEPVAPQPFKVILPDGTEKQLKGGYYPIKYNPKKSSKAAEQQENAELGKQLAGAAVLGTNRGFTKSRAIEVGQRPLMPTFDVIPQHITAVIHNINYRIPARDVYRLVNNTKFQEYVTDTLGINYVNLLKQWATNVWAIQPDMNDNSASFLNSAFGYLRRNATMAIMGFRMWPTIENVSNIGPIMDKLGAIKAISAVTNFYPNYKANVDLLHKSVFMANRMDKMDRDIKSQPGLFNVDYRAFEIVRDHAYDFMLWSDLMLSAPAWCQAYKDSIMPMIAEVKAESEANKQKQLETQNAVDNIKAKISDLQSRIRNVNGEINRRNNSEPADEEASREFNSRRNEDLYAEVDTHSKTIKDLEKDLFKAEREHELAMDLRIYDDSEINEEAEQRAILKADQVIRDTFGSGDVKDMSTIQRSSNELVKMMITFYSFFNTQFNAMYEAYLQSRYGHGLEKPVTAWQNISRWAPLAKTFMYRVVFTAFIGSLGQFVLGLQGSDDDDKYKKEKGPDGKDRKVEVPPLERFLKVLTKNVISTSTGGLVGIRDLVNTATTLLLDNKVYSKNSSPISAAADEVIKAGQILYNMSERNAKIDEENARKQENLKKKSPKARKKAEEEAKYIKPKYHTTYEEVARHVGKAASSAFAAKTGITNTIMDSFTGTMQYLMDSENRYDATFKNLFWSAFFDKKPVEREIPKKPEEPKKDKKGARK